MAIPQHASMPLAAVVMLLFAGIAHATTCPAGYKSCPNSYLPCGCNINTDVNNCGDCGIKCGALCGTSAVPACKSAKCEFSCKAPFLNCDNDWKNGCEVDGNNDVNNCGACGTKCIAPPYATANCNNGKCEYACIAGWKNCDGKWENGCETAIGTDAQNCGDCGIKCAAAPNAIAKCNSGNCENTCKATYADCDNNWMNGCESCTDTDSNNCGACGNKCKDVPNAVSKCNGGKCEYSCKPGYSNCDGDWTNGCEGSTGSDGNNCGACGVTCKDMPNAVTKCNAGKCEYSCKPGYSNCDGDWTNGCEGSTGSDTNNCGACGVQCKDMPNAVTKCNGGKCEYSCMPGHSNCDGDWTNGCEGSTGTDSNNCGACGVKCNDMPNAVTKCSGGKCEYSCKPGYSNCDGNWTNGCEGSTSSDTSNCGACGNKCKDVPNAVTTCNGGKCEYSCKPGYSNCDGDWTNGCEGSTGSDANNCGTCGVRCKDMPNAVTMCNGGKCEYSCRPGYSNCDGDWTNGCEGSTGTDSNNCGACGVKCKDMPNAVTKCNAGKCEYSCMPGYSNCDGDWTNGCEGSTSSDTKNCGACGVMCKDVANAVTKCYNGKCDYYCQPGYSNCDGDWTNGCEGACGSDTNNCGACGVKCKDVPNAWTQCANGKCVYSCKAGCANCDNNWMNGCECTPDTDTNHCGGCGKKCPTPKYAGGEAKCTSGKCETQSCKSGWKWDSKKSCCVDGKGGKKCFLSVCW